MILSVLLFPVSTKKQFCEYAFGNSMHSMGLPFLESTGDIINPSTASVYFDFSPVNVFKLSFSFQSDISRSSIISFLMNDP